MEKQNKWITATILLMVILLALIVTDLTYKEKCKEEQINFKVLNISEGNLRNFINVSNGKSQISICDIKTGMCVILGAEVIKMFKEKLNG